jgi:hypothetical protein
MIVKSHCRQLLAEATAAGVALSGVQSVAGDPVRQQGWHHDSGPWKFGPAIPKSPSYLLDFWFDDSAAWRVAMTNLRANASLKPAWATSFPYMSVRAALVRERPDLDLMSDRRVIQ